MANPMNHLLDVLDGTLERWLDQRGQAAFRARQIQNWLVRQRAETFSEMTNLPKSLRDELEQEFTIWTSEAVSQRQASDGTEKLLLQFPTGGRIECVLLRDGSRRTICISTQVGCAMGCVFCASGLSGVERNLTTGEIVEQMLRLQRLLPSTERLSHIVVMGMGEPLANLERLLPALKLASSKDGLGVSARRITISTVGIPAAIDRLAAAGPKYHLAVSLHAANDRLRNQLVPVNEKIGLASILQAADRYFTASGRRLTFEYVLLADVNDRPEDARQLARLLRDRTALLNIIPYNPVSGLPYRTPSSRALHRFLDVLEHSGINVQVRQRKGDKIDAACGQLRRHHQVETQ